MNVNRLIMDYVDACERVGKILDFLHPGVAGGDGTGGKRLPRNCARRCSTPRSDGASGQVARNFI